MNQKQIDRIRKLLALAESSNKPEAQVALQRAHEIMRKYGIDPSELNTASSQQEDFWASFSASLADAIASQIINALAEQLTKAVFVLVVDKVAAPVTEWIVKTTLLGEQSGTDDLGTMVGKGIQEVLDAIPGMFAQACHALRGSGKDGPGRRAALIHGGQAPKRF